MSGSTFDIRGRRCARPRTGSTGPQKSLPAAADGRTVAEFLAARPRLSEFSTPLLVLDDAALDGQHRPGWPAGAPSTGSSSRRTARPRWRRTLWRRQLRAGAWGITVANREPAAGGGGVRRAPGAAGQRAGRPGRAGLAGRASSTPTRSSSVLTWADSVDTVAAMEAALAAVADVRPGPPLTCWSSWAPPAAAPAPATVADRRAVAAAVGASPAPAAGRGRRLRGRARPRRRPGRRLPAVRGYLRRAGRAAPRGCADAGRLPRGRDVSSPRAAAPTSTRSPTVLAALADGTTPRCCCARAPTMVHDDGFYRGISPFVPRRRGRPAVPLGDARLGPGGLPPGAGLALLDAGKRDVPFDEGLPEPQLRRRPARRRRPGRWPATITAVNDQHAFLRLDPAATAICGSGDVVRLGLSHPCTAFDKWRWIPVVADDRPSRPGRRRPDPAPTSDRDAPHGTLIRRPPSSTAPESRALPRRRAASTAAGSPPSADASSRRRRPTARSTPTAWCWPPASSTCTPTPTCRSCSTRRTWPRSARA